MTSLFITFNADGTLKTLSVGQGLEDGDVGAILPADLNHRLKTLEDESKTMASKQEQLSAALVALDQETTKLAGDISPVLDAFTKLTQQNNDLKQQLAQNGITDENIAAAQAAVSKLGGTLTTIDTATLPPFSGPDGITTPDAPTATLPDGTEATDAPTDPTIPAPNATPTPDPGVPTDPPPFDPGTDPSAPIVEPTVDNGGNPPDPNNPVPTP
jgi:hypothetical protein